MGMVMILSVIGLIFHFTMAVYMYAINPGKYGVKKDPLFFLKVQNSTLFFCLLTSFCKRFYIWLTQNLF